MASTSSIDDAAAVDDSVVTLLREWINYYLTEFRFLSDYAETVTNTNGAEATELQGWLSRYGLQSTLKKTQDAYRRAQRLVWFNKGSNNKTLAPDGPLDEPSPKRIKHQHSSFVTPERLTHKQQTDETEEKVKADAASKADAEAKAKAIADEKAKFEARQAAIAAAAKAEARAKLLAEFDFVGFKPIGKKQLEQGKLSQKVEGLLLDRQQSIDQLFRALETMARTMGRTTTRGNQIKSSSSNNNNNGSSNNKNNNAINTKTEIELETTNETTEPRTIGSTEPRTLHTNPDFQTGVIDSSNANVVAPFIGITGRSGTGKTEFLRWIFNNCCTFGPTKNDATATALLERLNQALLEPDKQAATTAATTTAVTTAATTAVKATATATTTTAVTTAAISTKAEPFENILVLYASYKGSSAYSTNEGPICGTTVERLLRSFHGITEFRDDFPAKKRVRYEGFGHNGGQTIVDVFTKKYGKTGFVFLLDDLSEVQDTDESEYIELLDSILEFSQNCLENGTFCAVVGSSVSALDLCKTVVNDCGKVVVPIAFPAEMPELEAKARKLLRDEFHDDINSDNEPHGLSFSVTMKVLQSLHSARSWEEYICDTEVTNRINEPLVAKPFRLPTKTKMLQTLLRSTATSHVSLTPPIVLAEYVFLLASRNLLGVKVVEDLDPRTVFAVVDHLHGHLVLETDSNGQISDWDKIPKGTLSLPVWRLFQFQTSFRTQLFPQVQNWVWVETKKLFYEYGPAEATKTLEITTMALLELRKAMLQAVHGRPPSLKELFEGIRMRHNLSEDMLTTSRASKSATGFQCFGALPYSFEVVHEPTLYLSSSRIPNEKGIEGLLKNCFGVAILFQTKTYAAGGPEEICDWLVHAHKRARDLGYQHGEYIVQLFVPGDGDTDTYTYTDPANDENESDTTSDTTDNHSKSRWPANSMVFSDHALMDIFKPFINLTLY